MPLSMPFSENGVSVHFPDANYFRLGDCPAYENIKSKGVKEMDIGWFDVATNTVWLVELKAFHNPTNPKHQPKDLSNTNIVETVLQELLKKSIHTICQINTDRAGTQSCLLPNKLNTSTAIKVVHLIKTLPGQATFLDFMQNELRRELQPISTIFSVNSVVIMDYDNAVATRPLSWIV